VILGLQTDTFGTYGGIPMYNRLVCRVLDEFGSRSKGTVLIATDKQECVKREATLHPNLCLKGFAGDRVRFVMAALRIVVHDRINLTLAGHVNYAPLCLLLKVLRPRMRFGVLIYGWDAWFRLSLTRRWALQQADFIISISDYTKRQAVAINGLDEKRIFVLPNALEWKTSDALEIVATSPLSMGTTLLSVGRLDSAEQQKGFDTVIRALPSIAARVADVQYIIIGTGTDLERHKQLAREVGVPDRVHFLGTVDEATLRSCYKSCDVFVMPSAQEGFGFVYLEAMQYAKAVVAANSGGAPEVVEDQVTGRLVEYGNEEELAQALIELCLDPEKRTRLGTAGYQRLQERFTFAQFKRKLTEILAAELPPKTASGAQFPVGQSTPQIP
jgi:glycosyltransferase involved in cell wall biosynthesis